jgi:hypothetical protein
MILRARVRKVEDMPSGLPCCERMKAQLVAFAATGRVIEVTMAPLKKSKCQFCQAPFRGMRVHRLRGWRIDPRVWDIEEAPGGVN